MMMHCRYCNLDLEPRGSGPHIAGAGHKRAKEAFWRGFRRAAQVLGDYADAPVETFPDGLEYRVAS